jgi:hypothetical protein
MKRIVQQTPQRLMDLADVLTDDLVLFGQSAELTPMDLLTIVSITKQILERAIQPENVLAVLQSEQCAHAVECMLSDTLPKDN